MAQLYDALRPASLERLQKAISQLLVRNELRAKFMVHSPFGDARPPFKFDSVLEVPPTLTDDWGDEPQEFEVGLGDLEVLFSRPRQ